MIIDHNIKFPFQRSFSSWFSEFVGKKMLRGGGAFWEIGFPGTYLNRVQIHEQITESVTVFLA